MGAERTARDSSDAAVLTPLAASGVLAMPDWIIADTHFFHANIATYTGRPANHEDLIIERWRAAVAEDQTILHLGDVALGLPERVFERLAQLPHLPGRVLVIRGNHDSQRRLAALQRLGWTVVRPFTVSYRGWTLSFRHAPPHDRQLTLADRTLIIHGHIHEKILPSPFLLNVSVEQTNYAPASTVATVDARLDMLEQLTVREERPT